MNKQNFTSKERFPLSTQALHFMQNMIFSLQALSSIAAKGRNFILSGCDQVGNTISDGIVIVNGEILPFRQGTVVDTVTIHEIITPINADGEVFEDAKVERYVEFASGTGEGYFAWNDFLRILSNEELKQYADRILNSRKYDSTEEIEVFGETWYSETTGRKQVYCKTFIGNTPDGSFVLQNNVENFQVIYAYIKNGPYKVFPKQTYTEAGTSDYRLFFDIDIDQNNLRMALLNDSILAFNKPYVALIKYTKL